MAAFTVKIDDIVPTIQRLANNHAKNCLQVCLENIQENDLTIAEAIEMIKEHIAELEQRDAVYEMQEIVK